MRIGIAVDSHGRASSPQRPAPTWESIRDQALAADDLSNLFRCQLLPTMLADNRRVLNFLGAVRTGFHFITGLQSLSRPTNNLVLTTEDLLGWEVLRFKRGQLDFKHEGSGLMIDPSYEQ